MYFKRLKKANIIPAEFISTVGTSRIGEIYTTHAKLNRVFGPEHILELDTPGQEQVEWHLKYCNGFDVENCEPVTIYRSYRDLAPGSDPTELLSDDVFSWGVGGYYNSPNKDLILSELQGMLS